MAELTKDQIALMITEHIHEPIKRLFDAIGDPQYKRAAFENALAQGVAEAIFKTVQNGVSEQTEAKNS